MIKKSIGPNISSNQEDVLKAKQVFKGLGYYQIPSYGLTPYPDEALFSAIKNFQKDRGLNISGQITNNDKTYKKLEEAVKEKGQQFSANSPMQRCTICGAPHGGVFGPICWQCLLKLPT